jgi:hypothetical protein
MVKKHTALYDPVMTDAMPSLDRLRDLFLSAPVSTPGSIDVDIDAVIAMLDSWYDADEARVIERVLREHGGPVPDCYGPEYEQLISEVGLALAVHRQGRL